MVNEVVFDLRIFMVFFSILILFFSIIFDVIGRNKSAEYEKVG
jgi:multisubunit Na+/H+ antiporter MnhB subunit